MNFKHILLLSVLFLFSFMGCKKDITSDLDTMSFTENHMTTDWTPSFNGEDCTHEIHPALVYPSYRQHVMNVYDQLILTDPAKTYLGDPYYNSILTVVDSVDIAVYNIIPLVDGANDSLLSLMFLKTENENNQYLIFEKASMYGHESDYALLDGAANGWQTTMAGLFNVMDAFSGVIFCEEENIQATIDRDGPAPIFDVILNWLQGGGPLCRVGVVVVVVEMVAKAGPILLMD